MEGDLSVSLFKPWQVKTNVERYGSILEVRNTLNSIFKVKIKEKNYLVPVTIEVISRGLFVVYLSNVPDGDGYQPVAECAAVRAAEECLKELIAENKDFQFDTQTIVDTIEECVSKRLKRKLGAFAQARVKCGSISIEDI